MDKDGAVDDDEFVYLNSAYIDNIVRTSIPPVLSADHEFFNIDWLSSSSDISLFNMNTIQGIKELYHNRFVHVIISTYLLSKEII